MESEESIQARDVSEEVSDNDHDLTNMSDDEPTGDDHIELDMSNNSSAYFDLHQDSVYLIATHPRLPLVVSGGGDNKGYVWVTHRSPPKLACELTGHTESIVAGGFTADGNFLVTGDMNGQLRVWRARAGGEKWEFLASSQEVDEIVWIRFHPRLPLVSVGAQDGSVWVYDCATQFSNVAVLNAHSLATTDAVFVGDDDDRPFLLTCAEDAIIVCWNIYENRALYNLGPMQLMGEHPWVKLALSPSGRTFAAGAQDGALVIVKCENGQLLETIDTTDGGVPDDSRSLEGISWCGKAPLLAVGNVNGDVWFYDIASWRARSHFKLEDAVTGLQFVRETRFLVVSGMDGTLGVWDAVSVEQIWNCQGHSGGILDFAIQENGNRIISAGDEGVCLVFNRP